MKEKLYKVLVKIEVLVLAEDEKEAAKIAKENRNKESEQYWETNVTKVKQENDIPKEWQEIIPYYNNQKIKTLTKNCKDIFLEYNDDVEIIQNIIDNKPKVSEVEEARKENKPIKEKELTWKENNKELPKLRYIK